MILFILGGYKTIVGLKKRDPGLQVLISISSLNNGRIYQKLFSDYDHTRNFANSVLDFVKKHDFDGVEIDWENRSNVELKILLRELYTPLKNEGYILALATRPEDLVDPEIALMSDFLFFRAWKNTQNEEFAFHPAPLKFVSNFVKKWISQGVDSHKIILVIPLFGRSFTMKFGNATTAGSPVAAPGLAGSYTNHRGTLAYYEVHNSLINNVISFVIIETKLSLFSDL